MSNSHIGTSFSLIEEGESSTHSLESDFLSVQNNVKSDNDKTRRTQKEFWRTVVIALLLINGALAGFTYLYDLITRDAVVQNQFYSFANQISQWSFNTLKETGIEGDVFSGHLTSVSISNGIKWPFHIVPNLDILTGSIFKGTAVELVAIAPLVSAEERPKWEHYSYVNLARNDDISSNDSRQGNPDIVAEVNMTRSIFRRDENGVRVIEERVEHYLPLWQLSPKPNNSALINFNLLSDPMFSNIVTNVTLGYRSILFGVMDASQLFGNLVKDKLPRYLLVKPIFASDSNQRNMTGVAIFVIPSYALFYGTPLADQASGIVCVVTNSCGMDYTYEFEGKDVIFLGEGDHHNEEFDYMEQVSDLDPFVEGNEVFDGHANRTECKKELHLYPSRKYYVLHSSKKPAVVAGTLVLIFFFTGAVFKLYDTMMRRRELRFRDSAAHSKRIVSELFPAEIHEQLLNAQIENCKKRMTPNAQLQKCASGEMIDFDQVGKPIAQLFPKATVLFADIAGFTAWSSVREPTNVFHLLESIFMEFDAIANRRGVFKVETIGDCYLAVAGLPVPRDDHAVVMAKFARDCLSKMNETIAKLGSELGPGTEELSIRIGIHSGPVTAGVLRGEKSRFQLFGDTVGMASKIESTGKANCVHVSHDTAMLLTAAGKAEWVKPREDPIRAKGLDNVKTFWLSKKGFGDSLPGAERSLDSGSTSTSTDDFSIEEEESDLRRSVSAVLASDRLIRWNVDVLSRPLVQIVEKRKIRKKQNGSHHQAQKLCKLEKKLLEKSSVIGEVEEIITLPGFRDKVKSKNKSVDPKDILEPRVLSQLRDYVTAISGLYPDNAFHNFEHCSHVLISVNKLLSRIAPTEVENDEESHQQTYGITSDPLTQFACMFSALIHDVAHQGVSNMQLVKEKHWLAKEYKDKSVLEQHSVDIAWILFMEDRFSDLRKCIYSNEDELNRFRKLLVNSVMATDIFDKDLSQQRKNRWAKAFADQNTTDSAPDNNNNKSTTTTDEDEDINRKATIVIEHLIQASDVSHTMQHWHIYQKWNEKLFQEMYFAYLNGRADKDPSVGWYESEIWFFDNYVIPLTKKLADCGVFGVSSDELLNYALENRKELESKGDDGRRRIEELKMKFQKEFQSKSGGGSKKSLLS